MTDPLSAAGDYQLERRLACDRAIGESRAVATRRDRLRRLGLDAWRFVAHRPSDGGGADEGGLPQELKELLADLRRQELVGAAGRAHRPGVVVALVVGIGACAVLAVVLLIRWVPHVLSTSDGLTAPQRADNEGRVRTALLALLVASATVIGAVYTIRSFRLSRRGQLTERFMRAIDQLGHESMDVRLGGIYALERIAHESPEEHGPVIEVLTSFVREHSPAELERGRFAVVTAAIRSRTSVATMTARLLMEEYKFVQSRRKANDRAAHGDSDGQPVSQVASAEDEKAADRKRRAMSAERLIEESQGQAPKARPDVQAAMTVLARRNIAHDPPGLRLDLAATNLTGVEARGIVLVGARLGGALLRDADLRGAHLQAADLTMANLHGASLVATSLQAAVLTGANLRHANLTSAHLHHARLEFAQLQDANLAGAVLEFAALMHAQLDRAQLTGQTSWSDLFSLHMASLYNTMYDDETVWPEEFDPISEDAMRTWKMLKVPLGTRSHVGEPLELSVVLESLPPKYQRRRSAQPANAK